MQKRLSSLVASPIVGDDVVVTGMAIDSRHVLPGDVFCAYQGEAQDGHQYIEQAIQQGAVAVLAEKPVAFDVSYSVCPHLRSKVSQIAARFYNHPSAQLKLIGITGTNGKTSISYYVQQLLSLLNENCAVIGTLGVSYQGQHQDTSNTTPDALSLQKTMHQLQKQAAAYVAMEVSSHALVQGRCEALQFTGAIFSNLSQDHLDYHTTMQAYFEAKKQLFVMPGLRWAVLNYDDAHYAELKAALAKDVKAWSYSLNNKNADLYLSDKTYQNGQYQAVLHYQAKAYAFDCHLQGDFNLANLLASLAALLASGFVIEELVPLIAQLQAVSGRMQNVGNQQGINVVVDYAHTPDALDNVLKTLKKLTQGRLTVVFGCGGDRDKTKRPLMAKAAEAYADRIIVTEDNPRTEDSAAILNDICQGFSHASYQVIAKREHAIEAAIEQAQSGDCVLIAGKGHENYQIIGRQKLPFDDLAVAKDALAIRAKERVC